jgi:hypothetical protein
MVFTNSDDLSVKLTDTTVVKLYITSGSAGVIIITSLTIPAATLDFNDRRRN